MLYRRSGLPEEEEIVLCKVTQLFPNSVFVDLLEFNNLQGMIHISEIAPGRIRNLRDYVSLGRQMVCKVLRIDHEKGHIDLSLRRVNSNQRTAKLDEIKQELKSESLIKAISKKLNRPLAQLYDQIAKIIFKEYSHLYLCFKDVVSGEINLEKLGLEKELAKELTNAIIDKFKPARITLHGEIKLATYSSDGIDKIKSTLLAIEKVSTNIKLTYLGAGRYKFEIEDFDYKPAEANIKKVEEILKKFNDKNSMATFEREKTEK